MLTQKYRGYVFESEMIQHLGNFLSFVVHLGCSYVANNCNYMASQAAQNCLTGLMRHTGRRVGWKALLFINSGAITVIYLPSCFLL